jgi:hypothetical protein
MTKKRTLIDTTTDPLAKLQRDIKGTHRPKRPVVKQDYIKVTNYIRRDQVGAIDRIRAKRIEGGQSPGEADKSSVIRDAIDLLSKQEKV